MKRVAVLGGPGSGKSTIAIALGQKTGLPVYHMDQIHWCSGWVPRETEDKDRMTCEVHARERWIFEGGHSRTMPERLARADTVFWLDLPVGLRYWRVFKRWLTYRGDTRPDLPAGCPERLDWEFLSYIWTSRVRTRARIERLLAEQRHLQVYHLTRPAAVAQCLAAIRPLDQTPEG